MTNGTISSAVAVRLRADIAEIRAKRDRTGKLSQRPFRWIGEPKGYRSYGDLANDLEELLDAHEGSGGSLRTNAGYVHSGQTEADRGNQSSALPNLGSESRDGLERWLGAADPEGSTEDNDPGAGSSGNIDPDNR
jgi:hypothetical protein